MATETRVKFRDLRSKEHEGRLVRRNATSLLVAIHEGTVGQYVSVKLSNVLDVWDVSS